MAWRLRTMPGLDLAPEGKYLMSAPKLLGSYRTPRCKPGQVFPCVINGDREVTGITDAPIPWPYNVPRAAVRQLLVSGDLERAIRTESNQAVAYYFGVSRWQVDDWRRRLQVPRMNPGTAQLWKELAPARLGDPRKYRPVRRQARKLNDAE